MIDFDIFYYYRGGCRVFNPNVYLKGWWSDKRELLDTIHGSTGFLTEHASIRERIYCMENGLTDIPLCQCCGKPTSWCKYRHIYSKYCSKRCVNIGTKSKREGINIARYGTANPFESEVIKAKIKSTNMVKYGYENAVLSEAVKDKIKTQFMAYDGGHPSRDQRVIAKRKATNREKYGRDSHMQQHISIESLERLKDPVYLAERLETMTVYELSQELGLSHSSLNAILKNFDLRSKVVSGFQKSIMELLTSMNISFTVNDRNILDGVELDIVIPDKKIAIECNGTYWHSESQGRGRDYHIGKTRNAEAQGYRLIHLWEHVYRKKPIIVESRLRSILGEATRIYARKTLVVPVDFKTAGAFMEANHIQGSAMSSRQYGLLYEGALVAVMTFGKSRFDKNIEWELIRYATKAGLNVVGGPSKLYKYFLSDTAAKTVVTYAARDWNTGDLYEKLGFEFKHETSPSYYYTKNYLDFENRVAYQKHKLSEKLEVFDATLTEWDNMQANGFDRIWDCGNRVYHWINDK